MAEGIANALMNHLHRDRVHASVEGAIVRATVGADAVTAGGGRVPGPFALNAAVDVVTIEVRRHAAVARLRSAEVVADDVLDERPPVRATSF